MKRLFMVSSSFCCFLFFCFTATAQNEWPRTLMGPDGSILKIYQLQPDSFREDMLQYRSAFSLLEKGKTDPEFGMFQARAIVETERDERQVTIKSVKILALRLPDNPDTARISRLKKMLETGMPGLDISIPLDELLSSLDMKIGEKTLSQGFNNQPPRIFFATKPSILVVIDGEPRVQWNKELAADLVINTPFTILMLDKTWYLYGGRHWYVASAPAGPFSYTPSIPAKLQKIQASIDAKDSLAGSRSDADRERADTVAEILVSTVPAELLQCKGDPSYSLIDSTELLYVSNSDNDIFVDCGSQQFFILLSGRWFRSASLTDGWEYTPADSLPADFAKIPEGSPKDHVLASIAGTDAAREAVVDAQIPQTTRISRNTTAPEVNYDGDPKFADIRGTHLQYALNTPAAVLRYGSHFYCADNGVWFVSFGPFGPWNLSTVRPEEVDLIPPDCPLYQVKFIYVFDSTPEYVYTGYTPGYLNNYVYGPTVVYGTGFYYTPWWGTFYYPRPWTWGFNMWYNPWYGWCFGYDLGLNWLNADMVWGYHFWLGGWWGPRMYRPPYVRRHLNNDVYRFRRDGRTRPSPFFTDKSGNIFRHDGNGNWQQRNNRQWKSLDNKPGAAPQNLIRQERSLQRGLMRRENFNQQKGGSIGGRNPRPGPAPISRPGNPPTTRPGKRIN
ncbi:MAG: hypothetical protein Q8927_10280 [Bacteroidota bacterium]|nr:hypothetical protein [Bacteroidota bacterium]MDP4216579.1 hypothetical protein [Bacteroidota bacterium]MDP4245043.1 hypothetical protein [Bacteroidota bacterium]MDP4254757.1 hypothetical protein [Bacteroidota bacterium]MDP4259870.1 hypothetical protein [Bacteroidota bacterium]